MDFSSDGLKDKIAATTAGNIVDCPQNQKTLPVCLTPNGTLLTNMLFEENMEWYIVIPIIAMDDAGNTTAKLRVCLVH